jgi:hypothetical protein
MLTWAYLRSPVKVLDDENGRLKRMVVDLSLDKSMAALCPPSV